MENVVENLGDADVYLGPGIGLIIVEKCGVEDRIG